jgi:hypothetical protein
MPDDFAPATPFDDSEPEPEIQRPSPGVPSSPMQVTPLASRTDAAVGLVWAGIGTAAGAWLLGPLGALAGLAAVGSVRNGVRAAQNWKSADPSARGEGSSSATVAIFGAGAAAMLAVAAISSKEE